MKELTLDKIREILAFNKEELRAYLKDNPINKVSTRYMIANNMFHIKKKNIQILFEEKWFDSTFIEYLEIKEHCFLAFYLSEQYNLLDKSQIFKHLVEIIENHNPQKFWKHIHTYSDKESDKYILDYIYPETGCSLLSHAIFTCDKDIVGFLIKRGLDKNIIDNNGHNLYDRLTIGNHQLMSEEVVEDFINWMVQKDFLLENSKIEKTEKNMSNSNYAYYQMLIREKQLKKALNSNELLQEEKEKKNKKKI